jgi:hypothetical protein
VSRLQITDYKIGVGGRRWEAGDVDMSKFMNQTPRHVAWFVSECIVKLRETMPDLARHLEGYHVDMFPSDGDA